MSSKFFSSVSKSFQSNLKALVVSIALTLKDNPAYSIESIQTNSQSCLPDLGVRGRICYPSYWEGGF